MEKELSQLDKTIKKLEEKLANVRYPILDKRGFKRDAEALQYWQWKKRKCLKIENNGKSN